MKDRMNETATSDEINSRAAALTDLPVADEQAEETKGGAAPHVKVFNGNAGYSLSEFDDIIVGSSATAGHVK